VHQVLSYLTLPEENATGVVKGCWSALLHNLIFADSANRIGFPETRINAMLFSGGQVMRHPIVHLYPGLLQN
jgi:hypothetical protein